MLALPYVNAWCQPILNITFYKGKLLPNDQNENIH